jgi:hypothetical protein
MAALCIGQAALTNCKTMDLTAHLNALLSMQTPALPDLALLRVARYLSWAIVLSSLVMWVARPAPRWLQRTLGVLVLAWTAIQGPVSPAFWLGLAFQMPSLMSSAICAVGLALIWRTGSCQLSDPQQLHALQWVSLGGVLLGWILLLDTFAVFPFSVYAAGFSPAAVGLAALLAALPWIFFGAHGRWRWISCLLGAVLVLYVLLRLPTGNVWDALIDPLLWIALQLGWLVCGLRRVIAPWRGPKATRA